MFLINRIGIMYGPTYQCIAKVNQFSESDYPAITLIFYLGEKWTEIRDLDLSKRNNLVLVRGRMHNSRMIGELLNG